MNEDTDTPMQTSVVEGDGEGNNDAGMDTMMNEPATDKVIVLENSSEQVPPNPQDMNDENGHIMEQKYWKDMEILKRQLEWLVSTVQCDFHIQRVLWSDILFCGIVYR